ncbi:MAG: lipid-A-disaccharide synthase [Candidatus Korobacteraceae bacterium]
MRILISAGEASGEFYGAELMKALRRQISRGSPDGSIEFFGVGGEQMRAAGCDLLVDAREIAEVGIVEVIKHIPTIYRRFRQVVREAQRRRPDAAVLIDFPDFNLRLARQLHKLGVPVIYYVSPQLWAWKQRRIERVRKYVDQMLVIFPFEEKFYRERGIAAKFVGHPLANLPAPSVTRELFAAEYKLDPSRQWIALLPGSRRGEVSRILPVLLEAAQLLGPEYVYTVPVASTLDADWMASFLRDYRGPSITFTRDARATVLHARAAAVASGTSTLEAALIGTPFAMVYRVAPLTWRLGRRLVKVDRFAMVNLIAERDVVPELVQTDFTPQRVCDELRRVLPDGPARRIMMEDFLAVRWRLEPGDSGGNASDRAAQAVLSLVKQSK